MEEAIREVLNMEKGVGSARISCHWEIDQGDLSIECRRVFEVQKKSGLCFIGPTLEDAIVNSKIEDDQFDDPDVFRVDLDNKIDNQFNEFKKVNRG